MRAALLAVVSVPLTLAVTAAPAAADIAPGQVIVAKTPAADGPRRVRFALGAATLVNLPDEDDDDGPLVPAAVISLTVGDGRGFDFETRIVAAAIVEVGARYYLGGGEAKPFVSAGIGAVTWGVIPILVEGSADVGVELSHHVELSAGVSVVGGMTPIPRAMLTYRF